MSPPPKQSTSDLKNRVITCLNRLSDRDTLTLATNELESIARNLPNDAFASFLTCLSSTDSAQKSPVRRQCVRLLIVLSVTHGDALSPHLSKMLSSVLRRLRDSDSSVRSACVDAISSIASHVTRPSFSLILKPLLDCISHEQDYNAQIGASLCLAAGIEASPEPEASELKKLLPKLLKLVKSDSFKAKPALLSLIGSISSVGGASGKNLLNNLVPTMVEFLSNDDWAARKAAAETLGRLAQAETDFLSHFKSTCLASLDSRRFDKVKVVRETMNRTIELWKEVPGVSDETLSKSSSSRDLSCDDVSSVTPQPKAKRTVSKMRSSPPSASIFASSNQKKSLLNCDVAKPKASEPSSCEMDIGTPLSEIAEIDVQQNLPSEMASKEQRVSEHGVSGTVDSGSFTNSRLQAKRILFKGSSDEKPHRFGARVVPLYENGDCEPSGIDSGAANIIDSQQEFENLSLIQRQLCQIENQQSSLLELLQRFIGYSQNGMTSLERRVNGLEQFLDEMSQDLALSSRRISSAEAAGNTCCLLPSADFLSPKFWRKTDGQSCSSKVSTPTRYQSNDYSSNNDLNNETPNPENQRNKHLAGKVPSLHPTDTAPTTCPNKTPGSSYSSTQRMSKMIQDAKTRKSCYTSGLVGKASQGTCIQQQI